MLQGSRDRRSEEEALIAFGYAPDQPADDAIEVWPENMTAVEVFVAMGTQWAVGGMVGVTGLRYEALPVVMRLCGVASADRPRVFAQLRTMEHAALEVLNGRQ